MENNVVSCAVNFGGFLSASQWVSLYYESLLCKTVQKARVNDVATEKIIKAGFKVPEKNSLWADFMLENAPKGAIGIVKCSEMVVVAGTSIRYKTMQEKSIARQTGMVTETEAKRRNLGYFRLSTENECIHIANDFSKIYFRAFEKAGSKPKSWYVWAFRDGTLGDQVETAKVAPWLPSKDWDKFCGKDTDSYIKDDDGNLAVIVDENGNVVVDPDSGEPMKIKNVNTMALVLWDENTKRRGVHFKLHGKEIDVLDFSKPYNFEILSAIKEKFYENLENGTIDG